MNIMIFLKICTILPSKFGFCIGNINWAKAISGNWIHSKQTDTDDNDMPQATFAFFECYLKALRQALKIKHAPRETIYLKTTIHKS